MRPSTCIVVEYPAKGLPLGDWSLRHPGTTADLILEPQRSVAGDARHSAVMLARGLNPASRADLEGVLQRWYSPFEPGQAGRPLREWFGRLTIHLVNMARAPPAYILFAHYQDRVGPPWSHLENGLMYARMLVRPGKDPEGVLRELQEGFAGIQADVQVSLQEISAHDFGVWEDLVQASIGLSP